MVAGCLAAGLAALAAVPPAWAASLGGLTSAAFVGYTFTFSTGAPTVIAYDSFDGPNGTDLDGLTIESGGAAWLAAGGAWAIQGDQARSTSAVSSVLLVDSGTADASVEATVSPNGNTQWDAYVIANSDAAFTAGLLANWWYAGDGTLSLYEGVGGVFTPLATVSGLYPGGAPGSAVIRLESSPSTVRVYLDDTLMITHALDGSEQALLKNAGQHHVGIGADLDATSTFDNFHVDA